MIPLCTPAQVAASILRSGPVPDSDYGQTVIALVNRSKTACTIPAFPKLVFERDGKALFVTVSTPGSEYRHEQANVPANGSATLSFLWPYFANMEQVMGSKCNSSADLWLSLPSGLPLYVPVGLTICGVVEQDALGGPPLPSQYNAAAAYPRWLQQQGCDSWFTSVLKDGPSAVPRESDALDLPSVRQHGTDFSAAAPPGVVEHAGMATDAPVVLYDPEHETIASTFYERGSPLTENIVCTATRSVPYGVATGSLAGVATKRGVTIGTTQAKAMTLDGPAPPIEFGGNYSAIHYKWKRGSGAFDLVYLFFKNRVIAIDYRAEPRS